MPENAPDMIVLKHNHERKLSFVGVLQSRCRDKTLAGILRKPCLC